MNFYVETERLILRPSLEEDIEDYFALTSDPEVMKYIVCGTQKKKEDAMKLLQRTIDHDKEPWIFLRVDRGEIEWKIYRKRWAD